MKKKILCLLLFVSLVLTGCESNCPHPVNQGSLYEVKRPQIDYSEMKYVHYSTDEFYTLYKSIKENMGDHKKTDIVLSDFDHLQKIVNDFSKMGSLANLCISQDTSDDYYVDEYTYCYNTYMQLSNELALLGKEILNSPAATEARTQWSLYYYNYYLHYEPYEDTEIKQLTQEQKLISKYKTSQGNYTDYQIEIDGKNYNYDTLYDLFCNEKITYEDYNQYLLQLVQKENASLGKNFIKLIKKRNQIASIYEYNRYSDFCYSSKYARDYSPDDVEFLCSEVKQYIVPLYKEMNAQLYSESLYEELNNKVENMSLQEQLESMGEYFPYISDSLKESYDYMLKHKLYDLEYRENKQAIGYTVLLDGYQEPFMFNQPSGTFYDFVDIIHEFGHYNCYYENFTDGNNFRNTDVAEIDSQGLELLFMNFFPEIFGEELGTYANKYVLSQIVGSIITGCMYDEFQQKVYKLDELDLTKINQIFYELTKEYGVTAEYVNNNECYDWIYNVHIFQYPYYYISYAVSAIPALELWSLSQDNFNSACKKYVSLIRLGESSDYSSTLSDCSLKNPFKVHNLESLSTKIREYFETTN